MSAKILEDVDPKYYFMTKDGHRIKNLDQLQKSLITMSDDTFSHHTGDRNDFSNWVRDVYKDSGLANVIMKSKSKGELAEKIKEKLQVEKTKKKQQDIRTIIERAKEEMQKKKEEAEKQKEVERKLMEKKKAVEKPVEKKEIRPLQFKKEETVKKHTFNNKPGRNFKKYKMPKFKASVVDLVFGVIIGVIAIIIIKQLF